MKIRDPVESPPEVREELGRARRLEWITLVLMATVIAAIYLTMGASQTMKAAWVEDMLSLVPPAAFLVADRWAHKPPNERFPYGYQRAMSISFLAGAVALTIFGAFILIDSVLGLIRADRPSIGTRVMFGQQFWAGWLMVAALAYSAVVPFILGRFKTPLARRLHDKTLMADADMNRADWLTGVAGIAGILGVGLGFWWADAAAGAIISFSIVHDGVTNLARVVHDLMDRRPVTVDGETSDMPDRVRRAVLELPWVRDAEVRLREEGHVYVGEVFVVAREDHGLVPRFEEAARAARAVDWRVHDLVVTAVDRLTDAPPGVPG